MVFYRAKVGGAQPINGQNQISLVVPGHVRPGDYCVMWVATAVTAATITVPSWLTQVTNGTLSTATNFIMYAGFFPGTDYSLTVRTDNTTRAWVISAGFWGGVDTNNPYSFPAVNVNGSTASSYALTIQAVAAQDDLNVTPASVLNGVTADRGGAWETSGAATDYAGSSSTDTVGTGFVLRSTSGESSPRVALLPASGSLTDSNVQTLSIQSLGMTTGSGPIRSGVYARYVDANNYVAAYHEVLDWLYSAGPPYGLLSSNTRLVVEVAIAGVVTKWAASGASLPSSWPYNVININLLHKLKVTREGVIKYNAGSYVMPDIDTVAAGLTIPSSGKVGIYDMNGSATSYKRFYNSFQAIGAAHDNPVIMVLCGLVPNADTLSITSTPNSPVAIDEQMGGTLGDGLGRILGHRYFWMPFIQDVTVTLQDNGESGSVDWLAIGSIVLNPVDGVSYGKSSRKPTFRSFQDTKSGWKFYLADTQSFEHITMMKARGRNLTWTHNRPGSANFSIGLDSQAAKSIEVAKTCVIAYRDGDPKWSGPIWTLEEDTGPDTINVQAVGWLQLLEKRLLDPSDERFARFGSTDAGVIGAHLLALTNANDALPFTVLDVIGTQPRKRSYQRYQSIGPEIQALADIESGYDITIDPGTRELIFWNRFEEDLSSSVVFGYNPGGLVHNLNGVKRQRAADRLVNGIYVVGKSAGSSPSQQIDIDSIAKYGLFEEQASLSETTDPDVALAFAAGELAYRSTPLQIITISPKQWKDGGNVPRPLEDYHVGSIVKLSAVRGSINIKDQLARIFSIGIDIDDNGNETVSQLTTTVAA